MQTSCGPKYSQNNFNKISRLFLSKQNEQAYIKSAGKPVKRNYLLLRMKCLIGLSISTDFISVYFKLQIIFLKVLSHSMTKSKIIIKHLENGVLKYFSECRGNFFLDISK